MDAEPVAAGSGGNDDPARGTSRPGAVFRALNTISFPAALRIRTSGFASGIGVRPCCRTRIVTTHGRPGSSPAFGSELRPTVAQQPAPRHARQREARGDHQQENESLHAKTSSR